MCLVFLNKKVPTKNFCPCNQYIFTYIMGSNTSRTHNVCNCNGIALQPLQVELSYSQCSAAPVKMAAGHAVTISGNVYYGGGFCDDKDDEYCIYCYDLARDAWSTLPKLPVRYFGLGVVKSELVVVGGRDQSGSVSNELHVLANGKNWKRSIIPPMPTARDSPAVVSLPTHLVVAGGDTGDYTNIVEIYNISTSQWSQADRLPRACEDLIGIVCNNTVYLVGGTKSNHLNTVYAAQIDSLTSVDRQNDGSANSIWKELANTPLVRPSAVTISNTVFAVGGMDSKYDPTQKIHAYLRSINTWLYVGDLPSPVKFATTVALSSTEFLVIGGKDKPGHLSTTYKIFFFNFVQ